MTTAKDDGMAVWAAFGSRDPEKIKAVLTEDVRWIAPPGNATQVALGLDDSLLDTRDGIAAFLVDHFRRLFPEGARFEFTKVIAEGSTVMFEQRMTATTINGRLYDNRYCWVFEMDGARVREMREYMDTLGGHRMIFGDEPPKVLAAPLV